MKVIATKQGWDGKAIRNPGDEFDMPDGSKASWFANVDKPKADKPKADKQKADDLV